MKKVTLAVFATLAMSVAAQAATVCSMTLNSPDELEIIKKQLGTKDYTYVELDAKPENFCGKPDVQCDIVVVSAHFGGHFFGASTATKPASDVPLESLEELSCSNKCGNIFQKAKQVYLFGCNTLNGKVKDDRTPEEYVDILRHDNYGLTQAQNLAANIYSPLGGTYHQRMQHLFPNAAQIFGFASRAPVGKKIRSELNRTFSKLGPGSYIETLEAGSAAAANWTNIISSDLGKFSLIATTGLSQENSLTCKILTQPQESKRIETIRQVFERGDGMKVAMSLVANLKQVDMSLVDDRTLSELNKLKKNTSAKAELLDFVVNSSDAFTTVRLNILEMMDKIGWVSKQESSVIARDIVIKNLPKLFKDPVVMASLDSAKRLTVLDFKSFPEEYWTSVEMFNLVERFNSTDSFVVQKALDILKSTQDPELAKAAGASLVRIQKWARIAPQAQIAVKLLINFQQPELQKIRLDLEEGLREKNF
ncbi:MAG: hypothetical protein H7256_02005 [Bdellovibrio sp.]|nr:hypothetical protein [Bdellovibrio sp.]